MKKLLLTDRIANELTGSSAFFPPAQTAVREQSQVQAVAGEADFTPPPPRGITGSRHHATKSPRNHVAVKPSTHATAQPSNHDATTPPFLEEVRTAVRQLGKEAATYRFTVEEKQTLADILYTYSRQGYRTSENEITRIAVNWLLADYRHHGAHSVLARMLESLHR